MPPAAARRDAEVMNHVAAAMALAFTRRRGLAALLLCAAAVMPWIPAIDFLHHVWQLAPVSARG
jgi:hypothetical protein